MGAGVRELVNGGDSTQREEKLLWRGRRQQEPRLPFTVDLDNEIHAFDQPDLLYRIL